jgi:hypothetical protein
MVVMWSRAVPVLNCHLRLQAEQVQARIAIDWVISMHKASSIFVYT